jgi:DnaK suppressor protein
LIWLNRAGAAPPRIGCMDINEQAMAQRFRALLLDRAKELTAGLASAVAVDELPAEVGDFKDVAARDAAAEVDDAEAAHAAAELDQVREALRRIDDGSYGVCLDCGDTIIERRLLAVPTARYCASCQADHERGCRP